MKRFLLATVTAFLAVSGAAQSAILLDFTITGKNVGRWR